MRIMRKGLCCLLISKMIFCSCLTFLPVGRRHLAGLGLAHGPAGEGLELVAHQGPPEEGPAGETGGGGVEAVAELKATCCSFSKLTDAKDNFGKHNFE